jgi:uncharacterized protein YoxC
LQTPVATLLLLTAAVVLACIVVNYGVSVAEQSLNTESPQLDNLKLRMNSILNQTDQLFNETIPEVPSQPSP